MNAAVCVEPQKTSSTRSTSTAHDGDFKIWFFPSDWRLNILGNADDIHHFGNIGQCVVYMSLKEISVFPLVNPLSS